MPKVSVIIPTFNRSGFLQAALESVLSQTFQDFEIIVVDDASGEDVQGVVQRLHDPRIRYIRHKMNKGEAGARNTGLMYAQSEYIAFLDDDDVWFPKKLGLQVRALEKSTLKVGGIYSGYIAVDCGSSRILHTKIPTKRGDIYQDLLIRNLIGTPSTVLVRRSCIATAGLFDETIFYGVDLDFYLRIARDFHFEYIEEPLVQYNVHENRLSNNPEVRAKGLEAMSQKYKEEREKLGRRRRKISSISYLSVGVQFCIKGDMTKGMNALKKSIRFNPFEPRGYVYFGLSLLGKSNFTKIIKFKDLLMSPIRTNYTIR